MMDNNPKETIQLVSPHPYDEVDTSFPVAGMVPVSWLKTIGGFSNSFTLKLMDANGFVIAGSSIYVDLPANLEELKGVSLLIFQTEVILSPVNFGFIARTQERFVVQLLGRDEDDQAAYIPLIFKQLEPPEGANPEIIKKHASVQQRIRKYKEDPSQFYKELEELRIRREETYKKAVQEGGAEQFTIPQDDSFLDNLFEIFEFSEDLERQQLEEKYKEAIQWAGPLMWGLAGRYNGF